MDQFGKNRCVAFVANGLLVVNAILHFVSTGEILKWGNYLDITNQHNPHSQNYYDRVPVAEYLIIIGIFMLLSVCLSLSARVLQVDKWYGFTFFCWFATIFINAFNFAAGVFLMIWVSFNNRAVAQNHVIYADLPVEYRSMYTTIALDGVYTLVVGLVCSILLFTQDNYLLAKCRIENDGHGSTVRRTSEMPKLYV